MKRRLFLILLFFSAASVFLGAPARCAEAQSPAPNPPRHIRLLAIGNSFDGNMANQFPKWVEACGKGHTLDLLRIAMGGASLENHVRAVQELREGGKIVSHNRGAGLAMPLEKALNLQNWDYVTVHQVSQKSLYADTYEPWLGQLVDIIRALAPEAQILFYQTWAYNPEHPFFKKNPEVTPESMQRDIISTYAFYSQKYGFPVLPVGEVFQRATRERPFERDPQFDYQHPAKGAVAKEKNNLHGPMRVGKGGKISFDRLHAGPLGEFLIGGVWYAMLYGEDPRENPYKLEGMSNADAAYYKQIIYEITRGRTLPAPSVKTAPKEKRDWSFQEKNLAASVATGKKAKK